MSKPYKDLKEVKKECKKVTSCCAGADGFMYKCFPLLLETLMSIDTKLDKVLKRQRRPPTAYNLFIGKQLKKGVPIQEASRRWRAGER